jgi:lipopolysaccharide transport system permease protein
MFRDEIVIRADNQSKLIDFAELWNYRDLLFFLVLRSFKVKYAQSILGVGWAVIQPLVATLIFTIIFGRVAKVSSDGVPYFLFSLCAMVPWNYFSNTLTDSTNSLVQNTNMLSKVYFPRIVLPLAAVFSKLLDFLIGLVLLIIMIAIYQFPFSWNVLLLPLMIIVLLLNSLGLGLWLSALAIQYRDVKHAMTFLVQFLMYLAPVVYPTSNIPENWRLFYAINPMVGVIEGFRSIFLNTGPIPWTYLGIGFFVSLIIFLLGIFYFKKAERHFADVA